MRSVLLIISAARGEEEQRHQVELRARAAAGDRARLPVWKAATSPSGQRDAGRDGRALEVLHLAPTPARVLGGDVEARQPAQPAADEVEQHDRSSRLAQPAAKAIAGGSHAEGDHVGERVQLPAQRRGGVTPARDPPVEDVEDQRDGHEQRRQIEIADVFGGQVAHRREQRAHAAKAVGDREQVGQMKAADEREVEAGFHTGFPGSNGVVGAASGALSHDGLRRAGSSGRMLS